MFDTVWYRIQRRFGVKDSCPWQPPRTQEMIDENAVWELYHFDKGLLHEYVWIEVCDFCGGNCGQCGTSRAKGIPPNMIRIAENARFNGL